MTDIEINIIRSTPENIDLLIPLFDAYRQFYGQASDPEAARKFLSERLERDDSVIFIAVNGDKGYGFTQLYPAFSSVAMQRIWILNDLFVAPDSRRSKIAERLLKTASDFARDDGAKRLVLATAVDNRPAQLLYEKNGWVRNTAFQHYNFELD